jgi:hypothetical protein
MFPGVEDLDTMPTGTTKPILEQATTGARQGPPAVRFAPNPGQAARTEALRQARAERVKAALAIASRAIPLFR